MIFARTDVEFWHDWIWLAAKSILFIKGRLYFHLPDGSRAKGNAGGPSALVAYSEFDAKVLTESGIAGALVRIEKNQ